MLFQRRRTYTVKINLGGIQFAERVKEKTSFHAAAKVKRKYEIRFPKRNVEILSCRLETGDDRD